MKRNCELDLGLQPRTSSHNSINEPLNLKQHHLHILQNGRHCLVDVTELQARVIIWLASREMEEKSGRRGSSTSTSISSFSLQSQALMCAGRGLSMTRSLQSFLQQRKKRTQSHNISFTTTQ